MNRSNIEWCQLTWNPITGCRHGCPYCYGRDIARRFAHKYPNGFEPTFHGERLEEPGKRKKPAHIFAVSMGDVCSPGVDRGWWGRALCAMADAPQHYYTILTKNPWELLERLRDPELWERNALERILSLQVGTSISQIMNLSGTVEVRRLSPLYELARYRRTVLSVEPMLCALHPAQFPDNLGWLIIGGLTGRRPFFPPVEWIAPLVTWARERGIPVFVKDNAGYPERIREYPEGVPH